MNERDILAQKDFAVKEARREGETKGRAEGLAEGKAKGLAEGEARGRAEGLAEGEMKGKRETAKMLLEKGLDISFISEVTGLSKEEIRCL